MRKFFTFILLAAALLISVESWAYEEGTLTKLNQYTSYSISSFGSSNDFGTICVPERIVATQGLTIYDVLCVDVEPKDSTKVARLAVEVHRKCDKNTQFTLDPWQEGGDDAPWCPDIDNPETCEGKSYIDWAEKGYDYKKEEPIQDNSTRMKAGAAYFYTICAYKDTSDCKIWVDKGDKASAPVCVNGFYGTFETTKVNEPVTVFTKDINSGEQYLEQVSSATIPAHRGYFKGYFECVPWRWNTDSPDFTPEFQAKWGVTTSINPLHYPCTGEIKAAPRLSSNVVAFRVAQDAITGLYNIDFEHPIYLGKETNKRIENGQLIIEVDGIMYNAFGQRIR